jgi:hypothetical protein
MAIEIWGRSSLDAGLDSGVIVLVDERGADEFAQLLLVCGGDVSAGQLVRPEPDPGPEPPQTAPPATGPQPPRPGFPLLPPPTKTRRRRRFVIRLEELDPGVHAFELRTLVDRTLLALEQEEPSVSLNPANREEWGYIEELPAVGRARAEQATIGQ